MSNSLEILNASIFLLTSAIILYFIPIFFRFYKNKSKYFQWILWFYFCVIIHLIGEALYFLRGEDVLFLYNIGIIFYTFGFNFLIIFVEVLRYDTIFTPKSVIVIFLSGCSIGMWLILPNSLFIHPSNFPLIAILDYYLILFISLFSVLDLFYSIGKKAPKSFKPYSNVLIVSSILGGLTFLFAFVSMFIEFNVMTLISSIFNLSFFFSYSYAISKESRLIYVVQFKVYRLMVLDNLSGISIYSHTWTYGSKLVQEDLFSGMMQGLSSIVRESVGQGELKEIKMDEAIILLNRSKSHPITSILVTSRSSRVLRDGLNSFTLKFVKKFEHKLANTMETSQFNKASDLIESSFPFVP